MSDANRLAEILEREKVLDTELMYELLTDESADQPLKERADKLRRKVYSDKVYIRGLIEFTNYCKNNCFYCGIRASNTKASRYRLNVKEILECCKTGYELGFRTFVLQGGEDPGFDDKAVCSIVSGIKELYPDCAVTLSIGEKSKSSYRDYFAAGASRYLLRHETASDRHYAKLHPAAMSLENRKRCLYDLKDIGFQVGAGFMVGSPYQTVENILEDLRFLKELDPDMIGIGPFLHHSETPFAKFPDGSLSLTVKLISVLRLMFPHALIPATTALATIHPKGREMGLAAGANVVMPNLSPDNVKAKYTLYDNKACTGTEAASSLEELKACVNNIGYRIVTDIGDVNRKL